jgi:hypothetical protein
VVYSYYVTFPYITEFGDELHNPTRIMVMSLVPIPAAAWMFGSALIGLVGVKRKSNSAL